MSLTSLHSQSNVTAKFLHYLLAISFMLLSSTNSFHISLLFRTFLGHKVIIKNLLKLVYKRELFNNLFNTINISFLRTEPSTPLYCRCWRWWWCSCGPSILVVTTIAYKLLLDIVLIKGNVTAQQLTDKYRLCHYRLPRHYCCLSVRSFVCLSARLDRFDCNSNLCFEQFGFCCWWHINAIINFMECC